MEELAKQSGNLTNYQFQNIIINYDGFDKPIDAIPILKENGEVNILTNIRAAAGRSRLILQDLSGNTIKTLMNFGFENGEITVDNDNIYVFTSNSKNPMFYILDKHTFKEKSKRPLGRSRIQSVCCNGNEIFTFDMDNAEVQRRNKNGDILATIDITKRNYGMSIVSHTNLYPTSNGFNFAKLGDLGIDDEYRKECEKKFGKDFMNLNRRTENVAFDEATQTLYVGSRNIVYVANLNEIKGIMYFPNKDIMGLSVDSNTKSLIVSSCNWPEKDKSFSFDNGGALEILPLAMVPDRIKASEDYLSARYQSQQLMNICHQIVDNSNGDIDQMIMMLEELKKTELNSISSISIEGEISSNFGTTRRSK